MNRIGLGFDIHRLVPGRKLVLGGVEIPFEKGPLAHSDGDCLFHAIVDALLGAAALGNIGSHFPDTDPRWRNAPSSLFLQETLRLLSEKKWRIENIDTNLHMEQPKMAPHLPKMIQNISEQLRLLPEQISIKPRRGEGLDAVGRGEAVAAQAIVLLSKP